MSYKSGEFDTPITIKSKTATQNEYGEEVVTLSIFAEPWSKCDFQSGREFRAGAAGSEASKEVVRVNRYTFHYLDGLTEGMVIIDGGQEYDITKIAHLERRLYHQVIAQSHV